MTETNIFTQYLKKRNTLVKNKKILQSSYTPENLPHRDDKINEIVEIIAPSLSKDKPSNILIFGNTGTGKTETAHSGTKVRAWTASHGHIYDNRIRRLPARRVPRPGNTTRQP